MNQQMQSASHQRIGVSTDKELNWSNWTLQGSLIKISSALYRLWGGQLEPLARQQEWGRLEQTLKMNHFGALGWRDLEGAAREALNNMAPASVLVELLKQGADPFDAVFEEKYPAGCLGALMEFQQWGEAADLMELCVKSAPGLRMIRNIHERCALAPLIAKKVLKRVQGQPWHVDGPDIERCLKAVESAGLSINDADKTGFNALHVACGEPDSGTLTPSLKSSSELVEVLIHLGAKVNKMHPKLRLSPLMSAAHFGAADALAELLKHPVDLHAKDEQGNTALHHVCLGARADQRAMRSFKKNIKQLMESGADSTLSNQEGFTPRDLLKQILPQQKALMLQRQEDLKNNLDALQCDMESEALESVVRSTGLGVRVRRAL